MRGRLSLDILTRPTSAFHHQFVVLPLDKVATVLCGQFSNGYSFYIWVHSFENPAFSLGDVGRMVKNLSKVAGLAWLESNALEKLVTRTAALF